MKRTLLMWMMLGMALAGGVGTAQAQRVVSRLGEAVLNGQRIFVHVTVAVPRGADENAMTEDALRGQGARPVQAAQFKTTGLDWNSSASGPNNAISVTQRYNSAGEKQPSRVALIATHASWNGVEQSRFRFHSEVPATTTCPSLVKECPGPQTFDGFNDVGWIAIGGCCTLGVTWYATGADEADMALNTKFNWVNSLSPAPGEFDIETVLLHENGHVLGLDHSTVPEAVMEATYAGVRRAPRIDDQRGDIFLYPAEGATGSITGTVIKKGGTILDTIAGALVTVADLPVSATTDSNGNFSLSGIPKLDPYTLKVSKTGYKTASVGSLTVGVNTSGLMVELEASTTKGGGRPPR